ncbi:CGNR zinc finger domain-containing protein [Streptomyces catenulae]|uniref:CGNR zinc finger domain-containing protein n=1 Tax=Streptomyces catenulae TaxID=66875 RepID=UPI00099746EA|nr:CGNR zinc finger domain-containing protein [Streptomyces catenulae]
MAAPDEGLRFDCGRICLDLLATSGQAGELLTGPDQLRRWLTGSGAVPPDTALDGVNGRWVARFRGLREVVRRVLHAELTGGEAVIDLDLLNATAAAAGPPAVEAVRGPDGALAPRLARPPDRAALLAAVARDAVALLTDRATRDRLRRCEGAHCRLLFLDTSRGRRRRWCSSGVCGNRERVARHRKRAAADRDGAATAAAGPEGAPPEPRAPGPPGPVPGAPRTSAPAPAPGDRRPGRAPHT